VSRFVVVEQVLDTSAFTKAFGQVNLSKIAVLPNPWYDGAVHARIALMRSRPRRESHSCWGRLFSFRGTTTEVMAAPWANTGSSLHRERGSAMKRKIVLVEVLLLLSLAANACLYSKEAERIEKEQKEWAVTLEAKRLERGITFSCVPPEKSYLHRELYSDTGYKEGWAYTIHINPSTSSFQLTHEAYAHRKIPEKCYEVFVWRAQESGEIDDEYRIVTTISLNQDITAGCEALGDSPATEETRTDVFEWWVISRPPYDKGGWTIDTCTCNANAHALTQADIDRFYATGACPPCVPGVMVCQEE